jgi:drug/metabolite transporter (DMT)-like permease
LTLLALGLVVVGALIHAWWNLLAKHSEGGAHFVWSYSAVNAVLFMPLAVWALSTGGMKWTWLAMGMLLATGVLHLCYSLILQAGYRRAGLSVVYPVARGTGPALSVLGAIFFLGEHATVASAIGALLVVGGVRHRPCAAKRDRIVGVDGHSVGWPHGPLHCGLYAE